MLNIRVNMILLGVSHKEYEKDGVKKKSTNVKMMDHDSELYDFYVSANNEVLLEDLKGLPQMTPVDVMLEVGAYQLKPTVRLQRVGIPAPQGAGAKK